MLRGLCPALLLSLLRLSGARGASDHLLAHGLADGVVLIHDFMEVRQYLPTAADSRVATSGGNQSDADPYPPKLPDGKDLPGSAGGGGVNGTGTAPAVQDKSWQWADIKAQKTAEQAKAAADGLQRVMDSAAVNVSKGITTAVMSVAGTAQRTLEYLDMEVAVLNAATENASHELLTIATTSPVAGELFNMRVYRFNTAFDQSVLTMLTLLSPLIAGMRSAAANIMQAANYTGLFCFDERTNMTTPGARMLDVNRTMEEAMRHLTRFMGRTRRTVLGALRAEEHVITRRFRTVDNRMKKNSKLVIEDFSTAFGKAFHHVADHIQAARANRRLLPPDDRKIQSGVLLMEYHAAATAAKLVHAVGQLRLGFEEACPRLYPGSLSAERSAAGVQRGLGVFAVVAIISTSWLRWA